MTSLFQNFTSAMNKLVDKVTALKSPYEVLEVSAQSINTT